MINEQIVYLEEKLKKAGVSCNQSQLADFRIYYDLLLLWNKKTNLISKSDIERVVPRHFLESLAILICEKIDPQSNILDVGSGAGFPFLPISILHRDVYFIAVESKRLKALFLREVKSKLKLDNVTIINERCEYIQSETVFREKFDYIFSRAVGDLALVYQWTENLLKPEGFFIAWKGGNLDAEIRSLCKIRGKIKTEMIKMNPVLVDENRNRVFVKIRKIKEK